MTLIGPDNIFVLGGILLGLAWMGFWIDGNWLGRKTSGVPWVITAGLVLSNFKVIETPHEELSALALAAVEGMSKWIPAKYQNVDVASRVMLPIHFGLR